MKKFSITVISTLLALSLIGCSDDKGAKKSSAPGMKCGVGKCGSGENIEM